jgi:hypothetical protein
MKKFFLILFLIGVFFGQEIFAQIARPTSFDDRPICQETKGVWRQFGNGCADDCRSKFDQFSICTQALIYGCDCGKNRCWNGEKCVLQKNYKETYDLEIAAEKKSLDKAKEERKIAAKENEQKIISKFVVQDPNNQNSNNQNSNNQNSIESTPQALQITKAPQTTQSNQAAKTAQMLQDAITVIQPNSLGKNDLDLANEELNSQPDQKVKEIDLPPFFQKRQQKAAQNQANEINSAKETTKSPKSLEIPGLPEISLP